VVEAVFSPPAGLFNGFNKLGFNQLGFNKLGFIQLIFAHYSAQPI
jgi:hypothetical protein